MRWALTSQPRRRSSPQDDAAAIGVTTLVVTTRAFAATTGTLASTGALTFMPGTTSQTFTVAIVGDPTVEGDEIFSMVLSDPTGGAAVARHTATASILDDDARLATMATDSSAPGSPALDAATLQIVAGWAVELWKRDLGLEDADPRLATLEAAAYAIADLPPGVLGEFAGGVVWIDRDAAGHGWYVAAARPSRARSTR